MQVDNKGIFDGLRKGEKECIKPRAGDSDLWLKKIWEELHVLEERGILVEVEYYSVENQFERFRGFWNYFADSNSNFVVATIVCFERFEFLVCSKFNHTHHVAVHVHVLWLVCAHTIPFRMLWRP